MTKVYMSPQEQQIWNVAFATKFSEVYGDSTWDDVKDYKTAIKCANDAVLALRLARKNDQDANNGFASLIGIEI